MQQCRHERVVPVAGRFFAALTACLDRERPAGAATETVFVVLKGPNRGRPLTAAGVDEILRGARQRAGLGRMFDAAGGSGGTVASSGYVIMRP